MCWFCTWGWPKPIADIYDRALERLDGNDSPLHWGAAHIVWEDSNFGREHVQLCLDKGTDGQYWGEHHSEEDRRIVLDSLRELLELPDEVLDPLKGRVPEGYAGDLEDIPPPPGMILVKR